MTFSKHAMQDADYQERAVFAGGCFWCMVEPFESKKGILSVLSGYTGGHVEKPNYDQLAVATQVTWKLWRSFMIRERDKL